MGRLRTQGYFTVGLVAHIAALLFVSLYSVLSDEPKASYRFEAMHADFDRDMILNYVAVFTIIILYISYALKLTWPMRIEEALIIILIWSLLGNLGVGYVHHEVSCDEPLDHHHDDPLHPYGAAATAEDVENEGAAVVIHTTKDDAVPPQPMSVMAAIRTPCGWSFFNIYFSLLCIVCSLLAFLCDTNSYCFSFLCRAGAMILTILIFLVPIACNRFRLMTIDVLILKITLYNIVWNMNRFKGITENLIGENYAKGIQIIKPYIRPSLSSSSKPRRNKRRTTEDDDDDDEDDEGVRDYDYDYQDVQLAEKSPDTIFRELTEIQAGLSKRKQKAARGGNPSPSNHDKLLTRKDQQKPQQITQFEQLSKTNKRYRSCCFSSWKYLSYKASIITLIDFSRTIWILAICPIYLFTVIVLLAWLAYYIQQNICELDATNKTLTTMRSLHKKSGFSAVND